MKIHNAARMAQSAILLLSLVLSGCVVRTYQLTRDRVDQDLSSGNRGYLQGQAPYGETQDRKTTRATQVVEIELRSPLKFETKSKVNLKQAIPVKETDDQGTWGNRGFISESYSPEINEAQAAAANVEKYTVQKNDTLQKISKKFYGTTKKWMKIYEANKDTLKGPNKLYPGRVINIPVGQKVETLKETKENLK